MARRRIWAVGFLVCLAGFVVVLAPAGGQPPPGAFSTPFTTFRGGSPGLKMTVDLVEEEISFDAHVRVTCADGFEHWQLMIEGGRGGHVDRGGRFEKAEYEPAEAGERPPSAERATVEDVEESIVYGVPASLRKIKGRVFSNSVVGWIRFWEGPQRTPGSLHSKCGTGSADGEWVRFVAHRVAGPAQPHGHWPPRGSGSGKREATSSTLPQAFCQTPPAQAKGEAPRGFYRVRPRGCRFHRLGVEENSLSDLVFRIDWRRWTSASASGIGRYAVHVLNFKTHKHYKSSAPEVVRLSQPRRICGHNVFTKLEVRVYIQGQIVNDHVSNLDEVGEHEEGCPRAG